MDYNLIIVSVVLFIQSTFAASDNAPWKKWTFCKLLDDPTKNNECLVKAIKQTEDDLLNGSSYFGTPPLDPLRIDKLSITQSNQKDKAVAVDIEFTDLDIIGMSSWELKEIKGNWDKDGITGVIKMKNPIMLIADYKISGKVIALPITGQGKTNLTYDDMTVTMTMKGKVIQKKNGAHFLPEKVVIDTTFNRMYMKMDNLFNGNKVLGDNMNKFMNENWKEVAKDMKGPIHEGLGEAIKQMAIRVFGKIPFDVVSPK